jgi:hypothetical protein
VIISRRRSSVRLDDLAARLARPVARLCHQIVQVSQACRQLALAVTPARGLLDSPRHCTCVEGLQSSVGDASRDERCVAAHGFDSPIDLWREVDANLEELAKLLVETEEQAVELGRADEHDLEVKRDRRG